MRVKYNQMVIVVCNNTGEEFFGRVKKYTENEIILEHQISFDARNVSFKKVSRTCTSRLSNAERQQANKL